ncbi:MAG TPA: cation:proton antiporter, partial [Steroidobacteraceae bacterium]|nr:cation:proton antiporter [Steroidobacteraceae bacterium]
QLLTLLLAAVVVVAEFPRLHVPSTLGYLLVGVVLGPSTPGPVIEGHQLRLLAEFGIVFLLFTIGLNFSLPQIRALRNQVFALGTGQVVLTTAVIGLAAWLAGLPPAAAFVVGAVFAQSSTTVISRQLAEQGEDHSRYGRLGTAMSVFQDVTAVPLVIMIPALGIAATTDSIGSTMGWAVLKALLAFAIVFVVGRWVLRPAFHAVAESRSAELFTLTVLLVSLAAGWTTAELGLSMAFGAFLVGMMLGETEFRHQVEAAIRPFRDVLLGLFFVGIGMLFDLSALPSIWIAAVGGALLLMLVKILLVAGLVRATGIEVVTAWQTGLLLAVGGEFGFALIAIALSAGVIGDTTSQIALASVLLSIVLAPLLIRHSHAIATRLTPAHVESSDAATAATAAGLAASLSGHVIICGYGRIGQSIANFLDEEDIPYVALDLDASRVREAHLAGEPVYYGDASDRTVLESVGIASARLLVIGHHDLPAALAVLDAVRRLRPGLPVMVRATDESQVDRLRAAGATEVVPETLEAALMITAHALLLLDVPLARVLRRIQEQRTGRYQLLREFIRGDGPNLDEDAPAMERVHPVAIPERSMAVGKTIGELELPGVTVTALVRKGERHLDPPGGTRLEPGDVLVLFGPNEHVQRSEDSLIGR